MSLLAFLALSLAQETRSGFAVWDTNAPLEGVPRAQDGWRRVPAGETGFAGDLVVTSGRLTAVARRKGTGLELYSGTTLRARLRLGEGLERVALAENARAAATVELAWKGGAARFRLKRGDQFVECRGVEGELSLRVECPGRFAVLPDFFADDILVDARRLPLDRVDLPSENFVLHFTGKGDAIGMCVFENREQDVRVTLSGREEGREITGSEIEFGKDRKIWVGVLEAPGIWHSVDVRAEDGKKVVPLDWRMPFVAQWRVDFTRKDGLTDSWDMLLQEKGAADYVKPSWLAADGQLSEASRTSSGAVDHEAYEPGGPASDRVGPKREKWTTVLGRYLYPCWSDAERKGYLQPLQHKKLAFEGPVLLYPLNRLAETPVESFTTVDGVRQTLGMGPCQYILDVEGQKQEHVGRATCHVRRLLNDIFKAGEQKAKRKEIETYLGDAFDFVTHIRNRVLAYAAFGREMRTFVAGRGDLRPEARDEMDALLREIDERVAARLESIRKKSKVIEGIAAGLGEFTTPACVKELNRLFVEKLIDYEGSDWKDRLKKEYTDPLTAIGGEQDEMVGECRWVVKALRQKAGLLMATEPGAAAAASEIRARTQKMLRGATAYEGARH